MGLVVFILWYMLLSSSFELHAARDGLLHGCAVNNEKRGRVLLCNKEPFQEILQKIQELGTHLAAVKIKSCHPLGSVELNQSSFQSNTNLKELEIIGCGIRKVLPGAFEYLQDLTALNLVGNNIGLQGIERSVFKGLRNLRNLSLGSNQISSLRAGTFQDLGNLTRLQLSKNEISHLKNGTFKGLGSLSILDMALNVITEVEDGALSDLKNLKDLNLNNRKVWISPPLYIFSGLTQLQKLSLINWELGGIDFGEESMSVLFKDQENSLTVLNLWSTGFTNEDLTMLKNLRKLHHLILQYNLLGYLQSGSLPTLTKNGILDLGNNRIMTIDGDVFSGRNDLLINLEDNVFFCDCNLLEFAQWAREYTSDLYRKETWLCGGPVSKYMTRVIDYDPNWWHCDTNIPWVALLFAIGLLAILAIIILVIYCNWVSIKHWYMERRETTNLVTVEADEVTPGEEIAPGRSVLAPISSLPTGKTDASVLYDMYEPNVKIWVDQYVQDKLFEHPLKVTLQWAAGADVSPLWKQVKQRGIAVHHFLVIVTDNLLENHWPDMSANSGVENLSKFVLVLMGTKKKNLPQDLKRLRCPCLYWPETKPILGSLEHEREQFWKRLRLILKEPFDKT